MRINAFFLFLIHFLMAPYLLADSSAGASFLKLPVGAKGASLAEAATALELGAQGLFWNPASLSWGQRELFFGYSPLLESARMQQAAVSFPLGRFQWALGYQGVSYDPIDKTDDAGNPWGSFEASDQAFLAGFSWAEKTMSVGLNGKWVRSSIDDVTASAAACDAGVLFMNPVWPAFRHALSVRNLGGSLTYLNEKTPLPLTTIVGTSFRASLRAILNLDARWIKDEDPSLATGLEYLTLQTKSFVVHLRGGYNTAHNDIEGLSGAALGAGLTIRDMVIDYAWRPYGELGAAHIMTLRWVVPPQSLRKK